MTSYVITVDTEEEWDWDSNFPEKDFSVQNIKKIPKFQAFCNDLKVKPTYLVDYAVAADKESAAILRKPMERGECEIGAHLHPWCTPPQEENVNQRTSHIVNLPLDLVKRKLRSLTELLENRFGQRPRSFRAGRWGVNGDILKLLADEGYEVDTSVRPFYEDIGFSYHDASEKPYWPDFNNFLQPGKQRKLLELPASMGFSRTNFVMANRLLRSLAKKPFTYFRVVGILWHLGILRKVSLCPEKFNGKEMILCAQAYLKKQNTLLNMNLHSSTLLPGGSPYVSNEKEEDAFYRSIREVIEYVQSTENVSFSTLSEVKNIVASNKWSNKSYSLTDLGTRKESARNGR